MRVLSLIVVALAGCYDPEVRDCQFLCTDQCPDGLMCMAGLCRVANAPESCLCPTPPAGCTRVVADTVGCLATCGNARDWDEARTACAATPGWHLAVLDTSATRTAAEKTLTSISWIGLTHSGPLAAWTWVDGAGSIPQGSPEWSSVPGHGEVTLGPSCAALSDGKLYSDDCARAYEYACTPD